MATDRITLPQPTEGTALKMLARRSEPPPRILVHPAETSPTGAWVVSGDRAFMGIMPVPPLMRMLEHQQPWELAGKEWIPTTEFEWDGQVWERLLYFEEEGDWSMSLTATDILTNNSSQGLCRVLTDETHYWCISELFYRCATLLLQKPLWARCRNKGMGLALRASRGWPSQAASPTAYIMALSEFAPAISLAERNLKSGSGTV